MYTKNISFINKEFVTSSESSKTFGRGQCDCGTLLKQSFSIDTENDFRNKGVRR
jgi:hypothetical protein